MSAQTLPSKKSWRLNEIVILVVLSVVLGALWWVWTFIDGLMEPVKPLGLGYLIAGFWLSGGTIIPFLIRKPGAAFLGEVIAAGIEGLITQWGITALLWGAVQGVGAELVFLLFRYQNYSFWVIVLAGIVSALFSWVLDFVYSQYWTLAPWIWFVQIGSFVVSAFLLAGLLAWGLGRALIKSGAVRSLLPNEK